MNDCYTTRKFHRIDASDHYRSFVFQAPCMLRRIAFQLSHRVDSDLFESAKIFSTKVRAIAFRSFWSPIETKGCSWQEGGEHCFFRTVVNFHYWRIGLFTRLITASWLHTLTYLRNDIFWIPEIAEAKPWTNGSQKWFCVRISEIQAIIWHKNHDHLWFRLLLDFFKCWSADISLSSISEDQSRIEFWRLRFNKTRLDRVIEHLTFFTICTHSKNVQPSEWVWSEFPSENEIFSWR
jgi:hypothetical protein